MIVHSQVNSGELVIEVYAQKLPDEIAVQIKPESAINPGPDLYHLLRFDAWTVRVEWLSGETARVVVEPYEAAMETSQEGHGV